MSATKITKLFWITMKINEFFHKKDVPRKSPLLREGGVARSDGVVGLLVITNPLRSLYYIRCHKT
jgi:hypothetical protein